MYLLSVSLCVGQLSRHVEHNLVAVEVVVDGFCASLPMGHIQSASEAKTYPERESWVNPII